MIALLMVVQAFVTLWLAWACWRYARSAADANAALWQAVAELRMHHNALETATQQTFGDIGEVVAELELAIDDAGIVNVTPPPEMPVRELPQAAPAGGQLNGTR